MSRLAATIVALIPRAAASRLPVKTALGAHTLAIDPKSGRGPRCAFTPGSMDLLCLDPAG